MPIEPKPVKSGAEGGAKSSVARLLGRIALFSGIIVVLFIAAAYLNYLFRYEIGSALSEGMQIPGMVRTPVATDVLIVAFLFALLAGNVVIAWRFWLHRQKLAIATGDASKEDLHQAIQARYQKRFWVSFGMYSIIMLLAIAVVFVLKDSRIWYDYEPWYELLLTLKAFSPLIIVFVWAGGAVLLLFTQWRQSSADIVGLIGSIEQMQTKAESAVIEVPLNLQELQPVLQTMYDESLEDHRKVKDAEKKKSDLILYLAHDLKTPLTSVVGYLSLIEESDNLSESQRADYTRIAREKALRLESLINQFFEISKFNLYDLELKKTSFSLNLLLTQLVDEFYPLLEERNKSILLHAEEDLFVHGDADRLARALNNVLKNALAYSAPESTIGVTALSNKEAIVVSVTNRGSDISREQLNEIFEKFYRLDEARTSNTGGAGLGLAIAKEIVERHEGTISAESGGGETTFTITLPHTRN